MITGHDCEKMVKGVAESTRAEMQAKLDESHAQIAALRVALAECHGIAREAIEIASNSGFGDYHPDILDKCDASMIDTTSAARANYAKAWNDAIDAAVEALGKFPDYGGADYQSGIDSAINTVEQLRRESDQ